MLLTNITKIIKCKKVYNLKKNTEFKYIFTNSNLVKSPSLLVIDKNKKFKSQYIYNAIKNGCVGLITNKFFENYKIPQFIVNNIEESMLVILYKMLPNKPKKSIGITGTNGKTSVLWYISQLLTKNNIFVKSYGTLGYYVNNKKKNNSILTTPSYEILHQSSFSKKINKYTFIFEASSHALDQNRLKTFPINVAVLTNITHDHLDYHKTVQKYKLAKLKLFTKYLNKKGVAIINDKISGLEKFKKKILEKNKVITYGESLSDVYIKKNIKNIDLKIFKKKYSIENTDFSKIGLENLSCAIAVCVALKMSLNEIINSLDNIQSPPGRMQKINVKGSFYKVYVDYAHTPDALQKILENFSHLKKKPNIVFGCGGERDKLKRSKMGLIANKYANKVYITDDNPRNENPKKIREEIKKKCKKGLEIGNRKVAIIKAINDLSIEDTLIIAGKGHEQYQYINNESIKFSDIEVAKNALFRRLNKCK